VVGRRVLQLLEVVLVRPVVDVDLGLEISPAPAALLPGAAVSLRVVVAAQREAPMVAVTAVPRVREQDVRLLVVADPLPATPRRGQLRRLAAQATPRPRRRRPPQPRLPAARPPPSVPLTCQRSPSGLTLFPPSDGSGSLRPARCCREEPIPSRRVSQRRGGRGSLPDRARAC